MEFYFHPSDESKFKRSAVGKYVRTLIFDPVEQQVAVCFVRRVAKLWEQSCKNNIETDHRVKSLMGDHLQVYSWIVESKNEFDLPAFGSKQ